MTIDAEFEIAKNICAVVGLITIVGITLWALRNLHGQVRSDD